MAIDASAAANLIRAIGTETALQRGKHDAFNRAVGDVSGSLQDAFLREQERTDRAAAEQRAADEWRARQDYASGLRQDEYAFEQAERAAQQRAMIDAANQAAPGLGLPQGTDPVMARSLMADFLGNQREMADREATYNFFNPPQAPQPVPSEGLGVQPSGMPDAVPGSPYEPPPAVAPPVNLPPQRAIIEAARQQADQAAAEQELLEAQAKASAEAQERARQAHVFAWEPNEQGVMAPPTADEFHQRYLEVYGDKAPPEATNRHLDMLAKWSKTLPKEEEPEDVKQPLTLPSGRVIQPNDPMYSSLAREAAGAVAREEFPSSGSMTDIEEGQERYHRQMMDALESEIATLSGPMGIHAEKNAERLAELRARYAQHDAARKGLLQLGPMPTGDTLNPDALIDPAKRAEFDALPPARQREILEELSARR